MHRRIRKRHRRVEAVERARQVDRLLALRLVDLERSVGDCDVTNGNRPVGAAAIGFLRIFLHQASELPAVAFAADRDDRMHQRHALDGRAVRHERADAVANLDGVDRDDGLAVHQQRHLVELNAREEIALHPSDSERAVEMVVGLPDDEAAQPLFEDRRLGDGRGEKDEREDGAGGPEQNACDSVHQKA